MVVVCSKMASRHTWDEEDDDKKHDASKDEHDPKNPSPAEVGCREEATDEWAADGADEHGRGELKTDSGQRAECVVVVETRFLTRDIA
jgi:hypothetical protein